VADETLNESLDEILDRIKIESLAKRRFGSAAPGAGARAARYRQAMKYYAPLNNDQWPEDKFLRPGKVHITANIVRAYCDIAARLLSIPPRLVNKPIAANQENRRRAEDIERFFYRLLDLSGWDVWLTDWALAGEIFGVGILQPFWNAATGTPDVNVIEQPQNLMLGYGSSDYSVVDWAIYRYTISFIEAQSRWPDARIVLGANGGPVVAGVPVNWSDSDKADIVDQRSGSGASAEGGTASPDNPIGSGTHSEEYEHSSHLEVWDYWYRHDGKICNATLLGGRIVAGPTVHPELPIIPYLIYEAGHEPGSPEGLSTVELLRDTQMGYNRALSLWTQYTLDNAGTAYQVKGPTSGDIPEGVIPLSDEMIPVGENSIDPIQRNQNTFPINQLIDQYWELASRLTGIPSILFGQLAGAQTSGRATAVQIEAALNRLDPKRRRFYQTLKDLLRIWGFMLSYKNSKIEVVEPAEADPAQQGIQAQEPELTVKTVRLKTLLDGFDNWKIVAPEITPRDSIEATQNAANKVQAHLSSIESAMDEIGVEDPQHELDLIRRELADARLNPGQVQAYISALQLLDQLMQMQAQQQAAVDPAAAGDQGQAVQQAQDQQAQPTGFEDQNLATGPGGAPAPGAPIPGLELQGLIRAKNGVATPMSQIVLPPLKG
jgi:hypothetical protein